MNVHQVLVVEDDADIRDGLLDYLEDHGYQPVGAVHGRDALDRLDSADLRPCVIILDLMMPIMDGVAFREEQLRNPEISQIPVIIISAHADVAQRASDLKVVGQMAKPLSLPGLLEIVRRHCLPV